METVKRRYAGIDLGKREYTLAVIGKNGKMKIHQGKTSVSGRQGMYGGCWSRRIKLSWKQEIWRLS
ncbi:MAG: hypothetical protein LBK83_05720 [Treponema sp.]|jgi:hypothetical protein|nr:hypothetical protein [Treponema sp.]